MRKKFLFSVVTSLALLSFVLLSNVYAAPAESSRNEVISNFQAPPSNFDPVNASDADLAHYGLPPKPKKGTANYENWKLAVQSKHRVDLVAEAIDEEFGTVASSSANYSGYRVTDSGTYQGIILTTKVPTVTTGTISTATWGGLHSGSGIVQAGASNADSGTAGAFFWYENYPNSAYKITSLPANSGDKYYLQLTYVSGDATASLFISNLTTGSYTNGTFAISYPANAAAEFILENPSYATGYENVGNYDMTCSYSTAATGINGLDNATNLTKFSMYSGTTLKYEPTGINTSGLFTQQGY